MKKILTALFVLVFAVLSANAQSMSDGQIMEFILAEQAKGSNQQDIAKKLMAKGVSLERLMQLKEKYQAQSSQLGAMELIDYSSLKKSRLRTDKNSTSKSNASNGLLKSKKGIETYL